MAVNINRVYQKVLAIYNKEQRGYITPQEFNLLADRAQKEIYENYFHQARNSNAKIKDDDQYTDKLEMIEAKLSPFIKESIIQLDFLQNGWLSSNSVSPLFHPDVFTKNYEDGGFNINAELDNMLSTGREEYTTEELNQLGADFLSEYSYSAPIVRERPQERKDGEYFIKGTYFTKELQTTDEQFGTPHVVKYWDKNQKQYLVFKYNPNSTYYSLIGETKPSEPGQEEQHNKTVVKKSRKDK